jgi:hypothetical protein
MATFERLREFFNPQDITLALPSDPFLAIDREKAARKLHLKERGELNGQRNHPPADSTDFDEVEREIIAEISEHLHRAQIDAANNHRVYGERLSELALLRELSAITGASAQALGDYQATIINREGRLALAKTAIRESFKDLANFKREHKLERPAHPGIEPIYAWATFGLAWLVESLFNTAFLRVNDDYGLLGGFVASTVVAGVNIAVSGFVGRKAWPYLFHRRMHWKVIGGVATTTWLVAAVTWNLLAGHFRDAKAAGVSNPEAASLSLLVNTPFTFDSIYSYGLLAIGIVFALVAAGTAFQMKDPYPGYGDIYRRHEDRCKDYADEIELTLIELSDTRDEAIAEAEATRDELRKQFQERGRIIEARDAHRNRYREHQEYLQTIADALLGEYRAINVNSRQDELRPAHFATPWRLKRSELPVNPDEPTVDAEVTRAQQSLESSMQTVAREYTVAIRRFEHLDRIKESLGDV